jgi:hypothetical protein
MLEGNCDFKKTPMAPPGTKVLIHEKLNQQLSWDPHGTKGWYLGPALKHYRCYRVFTIKTKGEQTVYTIESPPTHNRTISIPNQDCHQSHHGSHPSIANSHTIHTICTCCTQPNGSHPSNCQYLPMPPTNNRSTNNNQQAQSSESEPINWPNTSEGAKERHHTHTPVSHTASNLTNTG